MEDRWEEVKRLLDVVLELPATQREAFLTAQAADEMIRAEVEALLAAYDEADAFLEEPAGQYAAPLLDEQDQAMGEGRRAGPYRLLRSLGRGGMGTVYLATRDDEHFEQQVAVKLIRRGLDTNDVLRRFLHERQILARLDHPAVARLLDGGETEDGRPFFAMEYVEGEPIDAYCDRLRLGVTERLRLFLDVCEAVQYAHRNLVVHRDLKPSNILVTEAGQVKLLDFGIAKVLAEDEAEALSLTQSGMRVMTPEYAAPEQVTGGALTTATDVYALGVLLYKLLTSRLPHRLGDRSLRAVERAILDAEPLPPSSALTGIGAEETPTREAVSRARATSPAALRRQLIGDLDTVVLKALKKEPTRRYVTVEAFADDLRRYLGGLPVKARKDTFWYRTAKFARRHRFGVAASVLFALLLASYALTTSVQAGRVALARDQAKQVTAFLVDLFEVADPFTSTAEALTVREVLARGAKRVNRELVNQPEVRGEMLAALSRVYQNLGLYDEARPLGEQALLVRRAALGDDHPDVAASLHDLADVWCYLGDYEGSDSLYARALTMRRRLFGEEHLDVAQSLHDRGLLLYYMKRQDEADAHLSGAASIRRRLLGNRHPAVAEALHSQGAVLSASGRPEAAEPLLREALTIRRAALGPDHPDVAANMTYLAGLLGKRDALDEAETLSREALALVRQRLGDDHPYVATSLLSLAALLRDQAAYDEAESLLHEALAIRQMRLGEGHPLVAESHQHFGQHFFQAGDFDAAERHYRAALNIRRRQFGYAHPDVVASISGLAETLEKKGGHREAARLRAEADRLDAK